MSHDFFIFDLYMCASTFYIVVIFWSEADAEQFVQSNTPFQNQEANIIYNLPKLTNGVVRPIKQFTKPSCQSLTLVILDTLDTSNFWFQ